MRQIIDDTDLRLYPAEWYDYGSHFTGGFYRHDKADMENPRPIMLYLLSFYHFIGDVNRKDFIINDCNYITPIVLLNTSIDKDIVANCVIILPDSDVRVKSITADVLIIAPSAKFNVDDNVTCKYQQGGTKFDNVKTYYTLTDTPALKNVFQEIVDIAGQPSLLEIQMSKLFKPSPAELYNREVTCKQNTDDDKFKKKSFTTGEYL